jgi:hypothetical protein
MKKINHSNPNRKTQVCLQDILLELMEERNVRLVDIQKETKIPWSSLYEMYKGSVKKTMLEGNILALAKFFNVSLHYLAFGVGDDGPAFGNEDPTEKYRLKNLKRSSHKVFDK